jgi:hypothetical protein
MRWYNKGVVNSKSKLQTILVSKLMENKKRLKPKQ